MDLWEKIVRWAAPIGGAIAGLLGGWTPFMTLLAIVMVLDYITGFMVAWAGKSPKTENGLPSSKVGFNGLIKKAFIIVVVLIATVLDKAIGTNAMVFQTATVFYYIANESLSIMENAALIDLPVPDVIKKAIEKMKDANEDEAIGADEEPKDDKEPKE